MRRVSLSTLLFCLLACNEDALAPRPSASAGERARAEAPASSSAAHARPPVDAPPPDADAIAIRDATVKTSRALETVESLCDEAGPRLSGSDGFRRAVEWATRTLKEFGFSNVHTEPVTIPHWERGDESASITSPVPHKLAVTALGGSHGTPATGIEAEVIEAESLEAGDKLDPAAVKGKILFYNPIMPRAKDGTGYGKAVPVRGAGATHAAKLGAVAVVIRSVGTDENRLPHTGAMRVDEQHTVPAAAISAPDAEMLHRMLKKGSVKLKLTLGAKKLPPVDGANVIGEVTGVSKPEEIVLLGAHLDSWDLGVGAIDDGAGVGIVTEAARQIIASGKKPKRTIRVVLYANEENGLAGGDAYAKAHAAEAAKHVLAMEADFGGAPVFSVRYLGAPEKKSLFQTVARTLESWDVEISDEKAHSGADISTMLELGVPIIDMRQDGTKYFDIHHSANDTPDKIDSSEIAHAAGAFAAVAFAAANADGDFGRVPEADRKEK